MSLPLAIAVIALADAALIGLVVFAMSRANRLTAHVSATDTRAARMRAVEAAHSEAANAHNTHPHPTRRAGRIAAGSITGAAPARS